MDQFLTMNSELKLIQIKGRITKELVVLSNLLKKYKTEENSEFKVKIFALNHFQGYYDLSDLSKILDQYCNSDNDYGDELNIDIAITVECLRTQLRYLESYKKSPFFC